MKRGTIALGVVFSAFFGGSVAEAATDPSLIEARRKMVDFLLANPGASPEVWRPKYEATVGAAEKKLPTPPSSPTRKSSPRARKAGKKKSIPSGIAIQRDEKGAYSVAPLTGAGDVAPPRVSKPSRKSSASPAGRDSSSAEDPSPIPYTGPWILDFSRPTEDPSAPKPSNSP